MPLNPPTQPTRGAGRLAERLAGEVYLCRGFLAPLTFAKVLGALDRLAGHWAESEALRLLGRGGTLQIRAGDIAVQGPLDEIRTALAGETLAWARACGFRLPAAPRLQLFPVKMVGDAHAPAYQEPHVDSNGADARPPVCTNVFYASVRGVTGGDLAVARTAGADLSDPLVVPPTLNALASFPGDRPHAVRPLYAGERLSVVINFY